MTSSSSLTVTSLLGDLTQYVNNPSLMQKRAMQALTQITNGTIDVVDATSPFAFCLEVSTCVTAALMVEAAALTRRLYPAASTTFDDLYVNMADTDYLNMFALPSNANFEVVLQYDELINALVNDPATGIAQITIPRNTIFYAAEVPYSLQYPINIRQLQHGGLQVVYDASEPTPLLTLDTNVLPMDTGMTPDGVKYLRFQVNAQQFFITTTNVRISSATASVTTIALTDQFYYCRAYLQNNDLSWTEIATTFTQQVYDPNTPTVALRMTDTGLQVTVPPVYLVNGSIRGTLRLDTYQTKGELTMIMSSYGKDDFHAKWLYIDQNDASPPTTAIAKLNNVAIFSTDIATGGRAALTFEQMRARVLSNSIGPRQVPITPAQIQALLTDDGYTVVKNVDVVTGRSFWATKPLPAPTDLTTTTNNVFSPANASMLSVKLALSQGATAYGCTVHSTGITVTSGALFLTTNGISSLVSAAAYAQLLSEPLLQQAAQLSQGNYFFTPFYYVLDDSTDVFDVRPYFLDKPTITGRTFVQENATTGLQASIANGTFSIAKTSTGYRLTLTTQSNAAYQALGDNQVGCQLAFSTADSAGTAYQLGVQQARPGNTGERTFVFDITTSYDIDAEHAMDLTSFVTATQSNVARSALIQSFKVLFYTTSAMPSTYTTSTIDPLLGAFQVGQSAVGITHEELTLEFGAYLPTLWNNYRSFAAGIPYQTYLADVPALRTAPLYRQDPITGANFTVVTPTPTLTLSDTGAGGLTGIALSLNRATLAGTSADVGKVFTFDNGHHFTVTAFGTTTTATGTLSGVVSASSFVVWSYDNNAVAANNGLVWTILAPTGSPILDSSNNPTYLHRAGDPVISAETGLPVAAIDYTTQLTRVIDFFVISAVYRFANDPITVAYMDYVKATLLDWLTQDLATLNENVLERTQISFYPSITQGTVNVLIENNVLVTLDAAQSLDVTIYVPTETANNSALLASLTSSTIQTLGAYLANNTTVATSKAEAALMAVYGSDAAEVVLKGFGGLDNNYSIMTMESSSTRLSIGKILAVQGNNQMTVQEAIKVTFVVHDV